MHKQALKQAKISTLTQQNSPIFTHSFWIFQCRKRALISVPQLEIICCGAVGMKWLLAEAAQPLSHSTGNVL